MKSSLSLFCCLLSLIFFSFVPVPAQDLDTWSIEGRVVDQNGAGIPLATIQLTSVQTGQTRTQLGAADGRYRLIQIEPGSYTLAVIRQGFAPFELTKLSGRSSETLRMDVTLMPATINAAPVVVTPDDQRSIDPRRTVVGATLARGLETVPNHARSPFDLVFLLPGVTEEPLSTRDLAEDRNSNFNGTPEEAGSVSLSGSPAYSNNFTIDGLDNNDDRGARERFQPSLDAIEEVQVITNQFSAEYGRASGGRINLRTRGGGTAYRGRAFYYFRDEALNANTFHNNSLGLLRLPLQEHDFGFTFSGPIIKPGKRAFGFMSYEQSRILDTTLIDTLVPVGRNVLFPLPSPSSTATSRFEVVRDPALAAEIAPFISTVSTPQTNMRLLARGDFKITDLHTIGFVYQRGRSLNLRQFGGGNRLAESLQGKHHNTDAFSLADNFVFSAKVVNQFRIQYSRLTPSFKATNPVGPVVLIALNDSLANEDAGHRSGTLVAGSANSGGSDRSESRWQAQEIYSYLRGDHSWKIGADIHNVRSTYTDLADATGTYNFSSAGDFLASSASRFRQTFQTNSTQVNTYTGLFVQDEWQILSTLLFNFGLRYERESILADSNNFGPRFSFAYNPFTSGKLIVRGGGGIFYNRALLRTIDDFTLGQRRSYFDTNTLRDPVTGKLMTSEQRRLFIASHLMFPQTISEDSALARDFGSKNSQFSRTLDPHLRIPESYQFNFGIEGELGRGWFLESNFTSTRGIHLWREFNANAPRLPSGYRTFTEFLASRDFANFVNPINGARPVYQATNAGELVRFVVGSNKSATSNNIIRVVEAGVPVSVINLNSISSSTALEAALAALDDLRPDPSQREVERLVAAGNSFYRAMTLELRQVWTNGRRGLGFALRAGYTLSSLVDDGIVNTSDALHPGDFRSERSRSLLDRRHRFVLSGTFGFPNWLGKFQLSPVVRIASEAPFNIGLGGSDRNLDDVGNDRPEFAGDLKQLHWRSPGERLADGVVDLFSLPAIGSSGNLPRNAGRGPGLFIFDLNVTREFKFNERLRLRASCEFDNVLNKTVFSFGSEFINFNALSPAATEEQRRAFVDSFLVATRTLRPRQIRIGIHLEF